jgi:uncharacterized protein (TIGR02145 family)
MKENLRTTHQPDNTVIHDDPDQVHYRLAPNNDESTVSTYGYLYPWKTVMNGVSSSSANPSGVQGICPTGWHVPSDAEWTQLTDYVGSQSQYVCGNSNTTNIAKALASTTGWDSSVHSCAVGNTPSNNNSTGFSALPAGDYAGNYYNFGHCADFWSATESDAYSAYIRDLHTARAYVYRDDANKTHGHSVRCVRD